VKEGDKEYCITKGKEDRYSLNEAIKKMLADGKQYISTPYLSISVVQPLTTSNIQIPNPFSRDPTAPLDPSPTTSHSQSTR
jgi:hypothetical protein